jgi:hypothetical protein
VFPVREPDDESGDDDDDGAEGVAEDVKKNAANVHLGVALVNSHRFDLKWKKPFSISLKLCMK